MTPWPSAWGNSPLQAFLASLCFSWSALYLGPTLQTQLVWPAWMQVDIFVDSSLSCFFVFFCLSRDVCLQQNRETAPPVFVISLTSFAGQVPARLLFTAIATHKETAPNLNSITYIIRCTLSLLRNFCNNGVLSQRLNRTDQFDSTGSIIVWIKRASRLSFDSFQAQDTRQISDGSGGEK